MKTITSKDIILSIYDNAGWNITDSKKFYKYFINFFSNALKKDKKITLTNFGTFEIKAKRERIGRNPRTGKDAIITARNVVKFKLCIALKRKIENNIDLPINGISCKKIAEFKYKATY